MKTVQLDSFAGVRNDVNEERFTPKDLSSAVNIELDETGKPMRRLGTTILDGTPLHSLWANDEMCLCVRGGQLSRLLDDMTFEDLGVTVTGVRVAYQRILNDVYWTDREQIGVVSPDGTRALATTSATATAADKFQARDLDQYSNSLGQIGGMAGVSAKGIPVRAIQITSLPPGQLLGYYKGRLYVAENNYLWYTQPYEYDVVNRAVNYIPFSSPIKTFSPVSDGIYVGSEDDTVFLSGDDPSQFVRVPAAPYGTVLGTETEIPSYYFGQPEGRQALPKVVQVWMSKQGLCAGLDGGQMMNLTGGRYVLPEGVATGASLLKLRGASPQLVTTLFS